MSITYKQETKNTVRHTVIRRAVEMLTTERAQACCVRRSYVRDLYDYFNDIAESHEQEEASKIDISYIQEWEKMHANNLGVKRPEELSVCILLDLNLRMILLSLFLWELNLKIFGPLSVKGIHIYKH